MEGIESFHRSGNQRFRVLVEALVAGWFMPFNAHSPLVLRGFKFAVGGVLGLLLLVLTLGGGIAALLTTANLLLDLIAPKATP